MWSIQNQLGLFTWWSLHVIRGLDVPENSFTFIYEHGLGEWLNWLAPNTSWGGGFDAYILHLTSIYVVPRVVMGVGEDDKETVPVLLCGQ